MAWLNSGEQVVRGPLGFGAHQFDVCSILWLDSGTPETTNCPVGLACAGLPPHRPYKPAQNDINTTWWPECQQWLNGVITVRGLTFVKRT